MWEAVYAFVALERSHCPISCPAAGPEPMKQYYNFKKFYSAVLLALVDAHYRFIWASIGAPGNTHYLAYFQSTSLWEKITKGELIPSKVQTIDDFKFCLKFLMMVLSHYVFGWWSLMKTRCWHQAKDISTAVLTLNGLWCEKFRNWTGGSCKSEGERGPDVWSRQKSKLNCVFT